MKSKTLFAELGILLLLLIAYWYGLLKFSHSAHWNHLQYEINLNDSYFIFKLNWKLVLIPYCFLVATVYLIKEAFFYYKRAFQNGVMVLSNVVFIALIITYPVFIFHLFLPEQDKGWTIYPPLSALPPQSNNPLLFGVGNFTLLIQLLICCIYAVLLSIIFLVFSSIVLGKSLRKPQ